MMIMYHIIFTHHCNGMVHNSLADTFLHKHLNLAELQWKFAVSRQQFFVIIRCLENHPRDQTCKVHMNTLAEGQWRQEPASWDIKVIDVLKIFLKVLNQLKFNL